MNLVERANDSLSQDNVRVKLKLNQNTITLRGTFPVKPGEPGITKQYQISLGHTNTPAGVKAAVSKARELDLLLVTKTFKWTPELLGRSAHIYTPNDNRTVEEWIEAYEKEFWKTHKPGRQSERTWQTHYLLHLRKLPMNTPLSLKALDVALQKTEAHTNARYYLVWQLRKFCEFARFTEGEALIKSYETPLPKAERREIPSDVEILNGYTLIGSPLHAKASKGNMTTPEQWQWMYGIVATYGLRPHEVFAIDLDHYTSSDNHLNLIVLRPELVGGTKTGERSCGVPPLYPDWVESFDLLNVRTPAWGGSLENNTAKFNKRFRTVGLEFRPYDLRHAYALRGHRLTLPIKAMSDYMGHSVKEHTETYQRYMDASTNIELYEQLVLKRFEYTPSR